MALAVFEPRAICPRCRRPSRVCYCAYLPLLPTRTRIVILQHPRERYVPIGTAYMASLCLPNAELHVGIDIDPRLLSDAARPPVLLYPGDGAIDVAENPPRGPVTLVVVDGTWSQAKKLVRKSPGLAALPRYAFRPPSPSEYRIRREPREDFVSTIEALMHVLGALEGDPDRFRALLAPFRAMVDMQIACAEAKSHPRLRKKTPRPPAPRVPRILGQRAADLVCVYGEGNAWPYYSDERGAFPEELVHWVARRASTGESFDVIVAPRAMLAPGTPGHVALGADELARGMTTEQMLEQWRAFIRDSDVVCSWGTYASKLFVRSGGALPSAIDLRRVARAFVKDKVGTLQDFLTKIGEPLPERVGRGRAGLRLAQLVTVATIFSRGE
jgi:DTW domain-containing protein YfiP